MDSEFGRCRRRWHGDVGLGEILFNAGTDGLKSIEVHGVNGLQAIYVDANGVGRPEIVNYT